jgi:hypothetical protein
VKRIVEKPMTCRVATLVLIFFTAAVRTETVADVERVVAWTSAGYSNRALGADIFPIVTLRFALGKILEDEVFTYVNPTQATATPPREHIVWHFRQIE